METPRARRNCRAAVNWRIVLTAALLGLLPCAVRATGDFYEEPLQTLPDYLKLDQLPAKSIDQIVGDSAKPAPAAGEVNFAAELLDLTKKPGREALASIDKMIVAARAKAASPLLNLLNDLRDLFAGPATAAETAAYVQWRIDKADQFGVTLDKGKAAEPSTERKPPDAEIGKEIEAALAKASPALKPHWLYLSAAVDFLGHDIADSQTTFLEVAKDYPKSPRAEAALFMAARCGVYQARHAEYSQGDMKLNAADRPRAKKLWDEYFAKYPHGRFLGDALGWYGAYAFDGRDFGLALKCYLQQLEITDHPELVPMATEMVEKTLSHIASDPKDSYFAEVAKYPAGAQALVYLVINTSESDNYDGKLDSIEEVRGWRKKVLPRIAAAIAAQSKLYQNAVWKPRYLAMLAYAASGAGQHDQAVKLLESAGSATEESDDLLMARGVVFHRAKKPGEAAKALQTLLEKFPDSPLAKGARLRLGLALADDHRGGEAVLALHKLLPVKKDAEKKPDAANAGNQPEATETEDAGEEEPGDDRILYGIEIDQIRALIDTLLNFAPETELAAAAQTSGLDPVLRLLLTEPIAERYLAKEQFDEAKKYMTPAQYGLLAAPLEKLTIAAREAKEPAAHAAACLKLGDAWAAARGKLLTYPLDTDERRREVYISFFAEANGRRADSAPFIGATGNYKLDLENRDELRHAFNWWVEASDAEHGTPPTAQALWRALKAMPQIADVSPYTYERAAARKWGDTARKLYDRLRTECPDSVEAKRYAVTWDFVGPKKKKPEDEDFGQPHRAEAGTEISGATALGIEEDARNYGGGTDALNAEIAKLESEAGAVDLSKLKARTEILRGESRNAYTGLYDARWVNLVDDLALFFSEPDPGPDVRKRYAELRFRFVNKSAIGGDGYDEDRSGDEALQTDIKTALADATTKPVADYFEFLNLAVIANHFVFVDLKPKDKKKEAEARDGGVKEDDAKDTDTYRTRDYPLLAKEAQAFLAKYPKSKKREAAMLLHARATYRSSEEIDLPKLVTWPQAARWEGGYEDTYTQQEPFEAKHVLATFDAYDHAYPHGRYFADIRNYRAAVALRQHEWKTALDLTLAQLEDHADTALDEDAAERLGDLFAKLADERYRADVLTAIKAQPHARELLTKYLTYDSDVHPLLYLKSWLREQLAAK